MDDGLFPVEALLGSGGEHTAGGTAELPGHLLTLSLGSVFLDALPVVGTDLSGPLGTLLLGGVTLSNVLAFLLLDGLAVDDVVLNLVLVVSGLALRLVDSLTLLGSLAFADQRGVAELDGLLEGHLTVVDVTFLLEGLVALLFLLGLEVGGVSGVATLGVRMLALDLLVVLGLLDHHDLVDTTLSGGGDGADVQRHLAARAATLTGDTAFVLFVMFVVVVMVVVLVAIVAGNAASSAVEGEGVGQVLALASFFGSGGVNRGRDAEDQTDLRGKERKCEKLRNFIVSDRPFQS